MYNGKKVRVACIRTGNKFDEWYELNLKHMVDKYSKLQYEEFVVIRDDVFDDEYGTFNNLLVFDRFREKNWYNIVFDLDVIIKGDCTQFLTEELHVCDSRQWQNDEYYYGVNQISSDIITWSGDRSDICSRVANNLPYYYKTYNKGIDRYLYNEVKPLRHTKGFTSIQTDTHPALHDVIIFNGHYDTMKKPGWWHKYTIWQP